MSEFCEEGTPDTLYMHVKRGSKLANLIPFAVEKFLTANFRKVSWASSQGATAKTVSCAEQFKQKVFPDNSASKPPHSEQIRQLYQSTTIQYQRRKCVEPAAGVRYVLEEPSIIIVLSKDPLPESNSSQLVSAETSFTDFLNPNSAPIISTKPSSRRRLEHVKKRKREPTHESSRGTKPRTLDCGFMAFGEQGSNSESNSLTYQSPRFAPATLAVTSGLKKLKAQRKKTHPSSK
ncbi:ribonucleases P/MRP protein subunit RPP25 [Paragonimus westermani]|uniref:Ribonucleases P/MRP protein subunit RPP25 n=1 Tax=Paragonimus westermani TaxID=34504 RepID=A0A5J4NJU7_9TREM|nr:ribonucleases P/MRP protein subunit RPP25 [Paragonimus westermani]